MDWISDILSEVEKMPGSDTCAESSQAKVEQLFGRQWANAAAVLSYSMQGQLSSRADVVYAARCKLFGL